MRWKACSRCRKSYDAIYCGYYGCRACGYVEPVAHDWRSLVTPVTVKRGKQLATVRRLEYGRVIVRSQ